MSLKFIKISFLVSLTCLLSTNLNVWGSENFQYEEVFLSGPVTIEELWQQVEARSPYVIKLDVEHDLKDLLDVNGLVSIRLLINKTVEYFEGYGVKVDVKVKGSTISFTGLSKVELPTVIPEVTSKEVLEDIEPTPSVFKNTLDVEILDPEINSEGVLMREGEQDYLSEEEFVPTQENTHSMKRTIALHPKSLFHNLILVPEIESPLVLRPQRFQVFSGATLSYLKNIEDTDAYRTRINIDHKSIILGIDYGLFKNFSIGAKVYLGTWNGDLKISKRDPVDLEYKPFLKAKDFNPSLKDVELKAKLLFIDTPRFGSWATKLSVKIPVGDEENLLSTGSTHQALEILWQKGFDKLTVESQVGMSFIGDVDLFTEAPSNRSDILFYSIQAHLLTSESLSLSLGYHFQESLFPEIPLSIFSSSSEVISLGLRHAKNTIGFNASVFFGLNDSSLNRGISFSFVF